MTSIRSEIDRIDQALMKLLAERQRWVEEAIVVKRRCGIPARVPERVAEVIGNARSLALAHHVDPALAETLWTEMVEWFIGHEQRALDGR